MHFYCKDYPKFDPFDFVVHEEFLSCRNRRHYLLITNSGKILLPNHDAKEERRMTMEAKLGCEDTTCVTSKLKKLKRHYHIGRDQKLMQKKQRAYFQEHGIKRKPQKGDGPLYANGYLTDSEIASWTKCSSKEVFNRLLTMAKMVITENWGIDTNSWEWKATWKDDVISTPAGYICALNINTTFLTFRTTKTYHDHFYSRIDRGKTGWRLQKCSVMQLVRTLLTDYCKTAANDKRTKNFESRRRAECHDFASRMVAAYPEFWMLSEIVNVSPSYYGENKDKLERLVEKLGSNFQGNKTGVTINLDALPPLALKLMLEKLGPEFCRELKQLIAASKFRTNQAKEHGVPWVLGG